MLLQKAVEAAEGGRGRGRRRWRAVEAEGGGGGGWRRQRVASSLIKMS